AVTNPFTRSIPATNIALTSNTTAAPITPPPSHATLRLADGTEFERLTAAPDLRATSTPAAVADVTVAVPTRDYASARTSLPQVTFEDGSSLTALSEDTFVEPLAMT